MDVIVSVGLYAVFYAYLVMILHREYCCKGPVPQKTESLDGRSFLVGECGLFFIFVYLLSELGGSPKEPGVSFPLWFYYLRLYLVVFFFGLQFSGFVEIQITKLWKFPFILDLTD